MPMRGWRRARRSLRARVYAVLALTLVLVTIAGTVLVGSVAALRRAQSLQRERLTRPR